MKKIAILMCFLISLVTCNRQYCNICADHIACKNDGEIALACRYKAEIIDFIATGIKEMLINRHNKKRNEIASGIVPNFPPAHRMLTIQWDDELELMAQLNVKTCKFLHDHCRNTENFRYSGQNLHFYSSFPPIEPMDAAEKSIDQWLYEEKYTNKSFIDQFQSVSPTNGHFTVMISDRNARLGCAMLRIRNRKYIKYITACNYATTNIIDYPIYMSGHTASECITGINPTYPALCSTDEENHIDVNAIS